MTNEEARKILDSSLVWQKMVDEECEALGMAIKALEQTKWIPVTDRLPEDKINPLTEDFYEYPVTVEIRGKRDVRYYKFGKPIGWDEPHWFFGSGIMDDFVIAWMPLPEPYKEDCEGE